MILLGIMSFCVLTSAIIDYARLPVQRRNDIRDKYDGSLKVFFLGSGKGLISKRK